MPRKPLIVLGLLLAVANVASASTPASQNVSVPNAGRTVHVEWTGTVPPGADPTSDCSDAQLTDTHTINVGVPAGAYETLYVRAVFTIAPTSPTDAIITVKTPGGSSISNDTGSVGAAESVQLIDPEPGTYTVIACAFAGGAQSYTGSLDLSAAAIGVCPPDTLAGIDLQTATIAQLQAALTAGTITSRQLVQAYLDRIATYNGKLDAIRVLAKDALAQADALDAERASKGSRGPLHGIPILEKDNVGTTDMPTTAGSIALEGSIPKHEAFLTARLRQAGAIILGKTNLSEFAGWVDLNAPPGYSSLGGQVANPYNFGDPSGSSSGSGVAAAMAFASATIGTETSGSILSPSTANSDVGIKPTVGLVSRSGVLPLATTFDTPGPIVRNVSDAAAVLSAIAGPDPTDQATAAAQMPAGGDYTKFLLADGLRGARIGVADADRPSGAEEAALWDTAIATMEKAGSTIVHTDTLANTRDIGLAELAVIPNEFKHYLNDYLANETPATLRVRTLSDIIAYNNQHPDKVKYGQSLLQASDATLGNVDEPSAIASRTATITGARAVIDTTMSQDQLDAIMAPGAANANIGAAAQYPSIAVPAGYSADGSKPFGITLLGKAFSEPTLIKFGYAYEPASHRRVRPTALNKGLCPVSAATRVLGSHTARRPTRSAPGRLAATGVADGAEPAGALFVAAIGLGAWIRRRTTRRA
jgi:amidase